LKHDRFGYWLEEAGPVEARPALDGEARADVVVLGGGYLGMWTAWFMLEAEPEARVAVVEAELCGHGPSGRNGGFVTPLWDEMPYFRRFGDEAARAVGRASADSVVAIGRWCEENGVDAWYRGAPMVETSTGPTQDGVWEPAVRACRELGVPEEHRALGAAEVRAHCASPLFRAGALTRVAATVQPARLSLGLRRRLLGRGVQVYERSPVLDLRRHGGDVVARTPRGAVRARAAVLAVNSATHGFRGFGRRLAVASSHIVLTEPVPDVLEELGWTGREPMCDRRTLLHYFRTTPDGRIAFGWGGGRMRPDRYEVDPDVIARTQAALVRFFPQLAGRRITHAWGGPIDVSPTHVPAFGSDGPIHHGFGFTGNGVGPSHLGGRILASLALDRRDALTRLPLVDPPRRLFPPEPLATAAGSLIRSALVAYDAADEAGRQPSAPIRLVAGLPRRLGLHLPR
jgi:glycine/D-amino acid oxidase-like deaminating enzyme